MKRHSITHFALRTLLATLPMIVFVGTYAVLDPFKVVHRCDEVNQSRDSLSLGKNAGFESIVSLERNLKAGRSYDSFIMGSSMSQAYTVESWKQYLPQGASVFHLDASEETLQGMVDKINYLNRKGIVVKNALIVIEEAMLHRDVCDNNFLFVRPWSTTGEVSWLEFQLQFFNAYKTPLMVKYSVCPNRYQKEMIQRRYATTLIHEHTDATNENIFAHIDSIIANDAATYFTPQRLRANHYEPLPGVARPGITEARERELVQLSQLLKANGTHYCVLIPPRYNRQVLHPHDLALLNQHLGSSNVCDLSRHPYASTPTAYYDWAAHLTTTRCDTLLMEAYCRLKTSKTAWKHNK